MSGGATPKVTVLLPVYNGERSIASAVQSILDQSYPGFELLVVDDGSTDGTSRELQRFRDKRIVVVRNPRNLNLPRSLNRGIEMARGEYIARMDADDVSHPARLAKQVATLDGDLSLGAVGTWARVDRQGRRGSTWKTLCDSSLVEAETAFSSPLIHPTAMIRKATLDANELRYDAGLESAAEDWDLWRRMVAGGLRLRNVPEALLTYRVHPSIGDEPSAAKWRDGEIVIGRILEDLRMSASHADIRMHRDVASPWHASTRIALAEIEDWLRQLIAANDRTGLYPTGAFRQRAGYYWFVNCYRIARSWTQVRSYFRSPLAEFWRPSAPQIAKMIAKLVGQS